MTTSPDEVFELKRVLKAIRTAAGGGREFTNRLQFIYQRAACAIDGIPWDAEWRAQYGRAVRDRTMFENEDLRERVALLEATLSEATDPHSVLAEVGSERQRQIVANGWSIEHDDTHDRGELAQAAAAFLIADGHALVADGIWPDDWEPPSFKGHRRNCVRAAAMVIAEIERLDRVAARTEVPA